LLVLFNLKFQTLVLSVHFYDVAEVGVLLRMLLILGAVADYGGVAQQSFQLRISFSISLNLPNMIS